MRRTAIFVAALAAVFVSTPSALASPTTSTRAVRSTVHGAGGFEFDCQNVVRTGNGVVRRGWLALSHYSLSECVTFGSSSREGTTKGRFELTDPSGASLDGRISGTVETDAPEVIIVRLVGGTGRFASARGRLKLGPIATSHYRNCPPETGPCRDWVDDGAMTGTITNVGGT